MTSKPYTIRMFMPSGNPNEIKIIDKMNWTGIGIEVARKHWGENRSREELGRAGIYILCGEYTTDGMQTLYIGQGDGIRSKIDLHTKSQGFWDKALIFVSHNNGLSRTHITWLEWALIERALRLHQCQLENIAMPPEPQLAASEKADVQEFLEEMLAIMPLVGLQVFEPNAHKHPMTAAEPEGEAAPVSEEMPAPEEAMLEESSWHVLGIGEGRLHEIKYLPAHRTAPKSALRHYAKIALI